MTWNDIITFSLTAVCLMFFEGCRKDQNQMSNNQIQSQDSNNYQKQTCRVGQDKDQSRQANRSGAEDLSGDVMREAKQQSGSELRWLGLTKVPKHRCNKSH